MKKGIIITIIFIALILGVFFIWQFTQSSVNKFSTDHLSGNVIGDDIKPLCAEDYLMKIIYRNFENEEANHDCSNIVGGVRDGEVDLQVEFTNNNDISLSIPCKFIFIKNNLEADNPYVIDKKEGPTFLIKLRPKSTEIIRESVNIPDCYDYWELNCKEIDELPECK